MAFSGSLIAGRQRFSIFDICYDYERLGWDFLQEKLEYKLRMHLDPSSNMLLIPTLEVSQSYFIIDSTLSTLKFNPESPDRLVRLVGKQGTGKSTILRSFAQRRGDDFDPLSLAVTRQMTLPKLRETIESKYVHRRKNLLTPR